MQLTDLRFLRCSKRIIITTDVESKRKRKKLSRCCHSSIPSCRPRRPPRSRPPIQACGLRSLLPPLVPLYKPKKAAKPKKKAPSAATRRRPPTHPNPQRGLIMPRPPPRPPAPTRAGRSRRRGRRRSPRGGASPRRTATMSGWRTWTVKVCICVLVGLVSGGGGGNQKGNTRLGVVCLPSWRRARRSHLDGAHDEQREGRHHAGDEEERVGAQVWEDEGNDGVPVFGFGQLGLLVVCW